MAMFKFLERLAKYCVEEKKMSKKQIHEICVKMPCTDSAVFQNILNEKYDIGACW